MTLMSNDQATQTKPWMVQGASGQEQPEAEAPVVRFFVQQIGLCFQAAGGVPSHGSVEVELERKHQTQYKRKPLFEDSEDLRNIAVGTVALGFGNCFLRMAQVHGASGQQTGIACKGAMLSQAPTRKMWLTNVDTLTILSVLTIKKDDATASTSSAGNASGLEEVHRHVYSAPSRAIGPFMSLTCVVVGMVFPKGA